MVNKIRHYFEKQEERQSGKAGMIRTNLSGEDLMNRRVELDTIMDDLGDGSIEEVDAILSLYAFAENLLNTVMVFERERKFKERKDGRKGGEKNFVKVVTVASIFYQEAMEVDPLFRGDPWEMTVNQTLEYLLSNEVIGKRTIKSHLTKYRTLIEENYQLIIDINLQSMSVQKAPSAR